jgi:Domain of unknown function (DUF4439)
MAGMSEVAGLGEVADGGRADGRQADGGRADGRQADGGRAGGGMTGRAGKGATVAALQTALAAEQAASYGYGVVGSHLTGSAFKVASSDCVLHERARDNLVKMITALGATPRPAAVAYRLPISVRTAADAANLAVDLELSVVSSYLSLVAVTDPVLRRLAAKAMQAATVRAAHWGAPSRAFPGLAVPH